MPRFSMHSAMMELGYSALLITLDLDERFPNAIDAQIWGQPCAYRRSWSSTSPDRLRTFAKELAPALQRPKADRIFFRINARS